MIDKPVTRTQFSTFSVDLIHVSSHRNCVRIYSLQNRQSQ